MNKNAIKINKLPSEFRQLFLCYKIIYYINSKNIIKIVANKKYNYYICSRNSFLKLKMYSVLKSQYS
jgi:hypothetical protein